MSQEQQITGCDDQHGPEHERSKAGQDHCQQNERYGQDDETMLVQQLYAVNDGVSFGDADKGFGVMAESLNEMFTKPAGS
jgi:hypothetical protein